jgi:hypothetical protein
VIIVSCLQCGKEEVAYAGAACNKCLRKIAKIDELRGQLVTEAIDWCENMSDDVLRNMKKIVCEIRKERER